VGCFILTLYHLIDIVILVVIGWIFVFLFRIMAESHQHLQWTRTLHKRFDFFLIQLPPDQLCDQCNLLLSLIIGQYF